MIDIIMYSMDVLMIVYLSLFIEIIILNCYNNLNHYLYLNLYYFTLIISK